MNFRTRKRDDDVEINLISLIDVLLFLVIFFMVTTTFVEKSEIALSLPQSSSAEVPVEMDKIEIAIDANGHYFVNGSGLINDQFETLKDALKDAASAYQEPVVVVNADSAATHQSVINILDAARQLGLVRITFAADLVDETSE